MDNERGDLSAGRASLTAPHTSTALRILARLAHLLLKVKLPLCGRVWKTKQIKDRFHGLILSSTFSRVKVRDALHSKGSSKADRATQSVSHGGRADQLPTKHAFKRMMCMHRGSKRVVAKGFRCPVWPRATKVTKMAPREPKAVHLRTELHKEALVRPLAQPQWPSSASWAPQQTPDRVFAAIFCKE